MNEALFKTTVMGGFSKSDVLSFIDKQDKQFKDRENDLVSQLNKERESLKNEINHSTELAQKVADLEKQLEDEKSAHEMTKSALNDADDTLSRAKDEVTAEIKKRNERIEALTMRVNQMTALQQQAQTRFDDANKRAEECENKLKLIDKTEDQIGRALLEAQKSADMIIENAKKDAADILSGAHGEADELISSTNVKISSIKEEAQVKLTEILTGVDSFKKETQLIHTKTDEFLNSVNSELNDIEKRAENVIEKYSDAFSFEPSEAEITLAEKIDCFSCCDEKDESCDKNVDAETETKEQAAAVNFDFSK